MIIHGMLLLSFFEVWCACTPHLQPSKKPLPGKGQPLHRGECMQTGGSAGGGGLA